MGKELVYKIKNKGYFVNKYLFPEDKKTIAINDADIKKLYYLMRHHMANKVLINITLLI